VTPLQIPGGSELIVLLVVLAVNVVVLAGVVGGIGYFVLRLRSGGNVSDRLARIERKIGRLEAQVERLEAEAGVERRPREDEE
jgi:hypothetical protein